MNSPIIPTYWHGSQCDFGAHKLHLLSEGTEPELLLHVYTKLTLPHNMVSESKPITLPLRHFHQGFVEKI